MLILYLFALFVAQVECEKEFLQKNECLNYISSILGDSFNDDLCKYRNLKWATKVNLT